MSGKAGQIMLKSRENICEILKVLSWNILQKFHKIHL